MKNFYHAFIIVLTLALATPSDATAGAVIFMYHHFGVTAHPSTNIRLDQFDAQLQHLQQAGYRVWPLEKIAAYLQSDKPIPDRTIAITIDDAYLSVFSEAFPRLKQRHWPFTVFVATDAVDKGLGAYMSWQQMRTMQADGASFANHSSSHDYLIRHRQNEDTAAWRRRIIDDIGKAQQRLTDELGQAPMLFAYPYGEYNETLKNIVRDLGYIAFGQQSGAVGALSDHQLLPRYPMAERFAALDDFKIKAATLAMPVIATQAAEPVIMDTARPQLTITLADSDARLKQLACYASHQGRMEINWLDSHRFMVQAQRPLPVGRSRYNCTAPAAASGRYYWFSQLWIRPAAAVETLMSPEAGGLNPAE